MSWDVVGGGLYPDPQRAPKSGHKTPPTQSNEMGQNMRVAVHLVNPTRKRTATQ
jgi:hypothetical protein